VGICLDALHRPSVDSTGRVFLCNRLDPARHTQIGNLYDNTLDEIWNGPTRMKMLEAHKAGRRDLANDLCKTCEFWGVASQ
jgi:radical SAM protein with 4Fe4S-binding SPASM domain